MLSQSMWLAGTGMVANTGVRREVAADSRELDGLLVSAERDQPFDLWSRTDGTQRSGCIWFSLP